MEIRCIVDLQISFIWSLVVTLSYSIQITAHDLDNLKDFVDSLTVENGYPCSHRRMKKYVSEVGIDNFSGTINLSLKEIFHFWF